MNLSELRDVNGKRETALSAAHRATDQQTVKRHGKAASNHTGELFEGIIDSLEELEGRELREAQARAQQSLAGIATSPASRFLLPTINEYRAALAEGADATGGYLVPRQQVNDFFDLIRARSVVLSAGPRIVDMNSETARVPKIATTTSVGWYEENGAISSTEMTFGAVDLTARKIGAYTLLSNEMLADSTPSVREMIAHDFATAVALGIDAAFLEGSGVAPIPKGMRNFDSITETHMGTNGAGVTMNALQDMIARLEADNCNVDTMAFFMAPSIWSDIQQANDDSGAYYWTPDVTAKARRRVFGVPVYVSSQIATDEEVGSSGAVCSYIILADMAQVVVGRRAEVKLAYSTDYSFNTDSTAVRATARFDIQPVHATAVEVLDGITS